MMQLDMFEGRTAAGPLFNHTPKGGAQASPVRTPAPRTLPRTGGELLAQSHSRCSRCEATGHATLYTWHADSDELLCHPCNAGKLGFAAIPNASGVYHESAERITLPRDVKNWQGVSVAEIDLLDLGPHWIFSTSYQLYGGDCRGSFSPLTNHPSNRAASRAAALDAAKATLREAMEGVDNKDARRVLAWLDELDRSALL
jgi:hypothetical protein